MAARRFPRLSVQTKVLIPVLVFLALLPGFMVWVVSDHISGQMQAESRRTLATAETVFQKLLELRTSDLMTRYRNEAGAANFKGVVSTHDAPTINLYLGDMLEKFPEDEVALLLDDRGELFSWARKEAAVSAPDFAAGVKPLVRPALFGEAGTGSVTINGRIYLAVAVPVVISGKGPPEGVLVMGNRLGEKAVQELKALTHTEIVLLADATHVAAATLPAGDARTALADAAPDAAGAELQPLLLDGEHFLVQQGAFETAAGRPGFAYRLLLSYEERLRALEDTRRMLIGVSVLGILLSSVVIWGLVRRIIQPLRELAEAAEAVGRGDFSRRLERVSNDECGDLAGAFNRMTANLQGSRAELEKTVETLRTTQQQLVQSEKLSAVGQFVAGVAHELNNPLTAVIGFADLLAQVGTDEKMRPHLDLIARSAHRCHKIVQSLLSFARQHAPERKLVRINAVIDDVLEIMAYDLRTSNIKVVKEYGEELPEIMADAHQLQQVFVNILSNARQALLTFRQDGRIAVRTRRAGEFMRVEFQDNGPGIKPENLSRIFDPFFTTKAVGKGTGLGLSLSYGIISEHGGRIFAQSEDGHGAMFVIELPLAAGAGALRREEPAKRAAPVVSGRGRSVLVLDDEEWILELSKALLERDGYRVVAVSSGERAIESLSHFDFDVIVSDWKMPGMSGMQFYEHLLTTNAPLARRVLFMSGDVINDIFNDFLHRHNKVCLSKPFDIDEFRAAVARLAVG